MVGQGRNDKEEGRGTRLQREDFELHAAVVGATFFGVVIIDGHALPVAVVLDALLADTFADQIVSHGFGTVLREPLVVACRAFVVGVPTDFETHLRMFFQ